MKINVKDRQGVDTGKIIELPSDIFGITPNDHAIYLDVKQFLANQRQGTHSSTEKGDIKGSTRKLKKQKGTGTARAGSIKSGVFRGGGRMHGPRPRDYSFKLNKKLKQLARKSALSYKLAENNITILDSIGIDSPKTSAFKTIISNLNFTNDRTLFVVPNIDKNAYLSSRNLPLTDLVVAENLNTYDVLKAKKLVVVEGAVERIKEILK